MQKPAVQGALYIRQLIAAVAAVAMLLMISPRVYATSALVNPPIFWDSNSDAIPDDIGVKGYEAGPQWSNGPNSRFADGFNNWKNNTDFDPATGTSGQPVYIDRYAPCYGGGTSWNEGAFVAFAVVCPHYTWRSAFEYYRLTSTPTYFNHRFDLYAPLSWWYGAGVPPATQPFSVHFGGVLTHELGHWLLLGDLDCAPGQTMCHSNGSGADSIAQDTFDAFSLQAQDISDANSLY